MPEAQDGEDLRVKIPREAILLSIDAEILHVTGWAETLGVSVSVERDDDRNLFMSDIGRNRSDPGTRGNGALVIGKLCEVADAFCLSFETSHMTDEPGLGRYYAQFGFVAYGEPGPITNLRRRGPSRH